MIQDVNILEELFYSVEAWGLLGVLLMVTFTILLARRSKTLGFVWWIVGSLMAIIYYMPMTETNALFSWHIVILVFGGMLGLIISSTE